MQFRIWEGCKEVAEGFPCDHIPVSLAGIANRGPGVDPGFGYQQRNPRSATATTGCRQVVVAALVCTVCSFPAGVFCRVFIGNADDLEAYFGA